MSLKSILSLLSVVLLSSFAFAQTKPANPARDSVLNKMCDCITKSGKLNNAEKAQEAVQTCMMDIIAADPVGTMMDLGLEDFEDAAAMQKFGEEVGFDLMKKCPAMKDMAISMAKSQMTTSTAIGGSTTGKFIKAENDNYQYIVVDENGKQVKLLVLFPFTNAEALVKDPTKMNGKTLTIDWKEVEIWNTKTKLFEKQKQITGFSF
jgi:hypothetical protein